MVMRAWPHDQPRAMETAFKFDEKFKNPSICECHYGRVGWTFGKFRKLVSRQITKTREKIKLSKVNKWEMVAGACVPRVCDDCSQMEFHSVRESGKNMLSILIAHSFGKIHLCSTSIAVAYLTVTAKKSSGRTMRTRTILGRREKMPTIDDLFRLQNSFAFVDSLSLNVGNVARAISAISAPSNSFFYSILYSTEACFFLLFSISILSAFDTLACTTWAAYRRSIKMNA